MALFVLSDTHLAIHHADKSMETFGFRWQNYIARIEANWRRLVTDTDAVVIPGDISWGLTLKDTVEDFAFLHSLPGTKYIGKGNHDFFWTTMTKMTAFFEEHGWSDFRILYNNAFLWEGMILCGTRGWFNDPKLQKTVGEVDYDKIVNRECIRLQMSLEAAKVLQGTTDAEIIPFLHFPPVWTDFRFEGFLSLFREYGVRRCYFGHIHSPENGFSTRHEDGIDYILASADHLRFTPLPVFPTGRYFQKENADAFKAR